jgi:hypothetical protein
MVRPAARAAPASGAASSRSRSTPAIPVLAERVKKGADTKVRARITTIGADAVVRFLDAIYPDRADGSADQGP